VCKWLSVPKVGPATVESRVARQRAVVERAAGHPATGCGRRVSCQACSCWSVLPEAPPPEGCGVTRHCAVVERAKVGPRHRSRRPSLPVSVQFVTTALADSHHTPPPDRYASLRGTSRYLLRRPVGQREACQHSPRWSDTHTATAAAIIGRAGHLVARNHRHRRPRLNALHRDRFGHRHTVCSS